MKKQMLKSFITVNICLLIIGNANTQSLKPPIIDVKKGEVYNYHLGINISSTQSMGGNQIESSVTQLMDMGFEVEATTSDLVNLIGKIHHLSVHISTQGMDTTNSYSEESAHYKLVYDKFGKEIKREATDTFQTAVSGQLNMENPATSFSPFIKLPGKKIEPGEIWTEEKIDTIVNNPFKELIIQTSGTYKYAGIETKDQIDFYVIQFSQEMAVLGTGEISGMQIFAEGEGANEGNMYILKDSGIIYNSKTITEMNLNIAISGQQSMTIPMVQKIESDMQLTIE